MKGKVQQVFEGEWVDWNRRERWICCDCSLTHAVEFRKRKNRLQVRMYRNNRSTAAFRRNQGIKVMVKKKR